ncbi:MAG: lamin tail domain-containing protein [Flavobacteriales bacterium]|nr:lamin tail domain-containing protein [Flavobacteriales bacterium]
MRKKILLLPSILGVLSVISIVSSSFAQNCQEVFISEYVEGWSNNKAIEIYNPTGAPKDISEYGLVRFANGSTDFGEISYLTGVIIPAYDVVVVVLDKLDTAGIALEAPIWDELQAVADVYINPTYDNGIWPMYFNGDDAVALLTNDGETLVDLFGRIGEGSDFPGWGLYTDSEGAQLYQSRDHTLIRHSDVDGGVTVNPTSFDIEAEWDSLSANTFDHLGWHDCICGTDVNELASKANVRFFPNPAQGDNLSIVSDQMMVAIKMTDVEGKIISEDNEINDIMHRVEVAAILPGVYIVQVTLGDGSVVQQRIVR